MTGRHGPGSGATNTPAGDRSPARSRRPSPDLLLALLVAAALVALAMISGGGVDNLVATQRNTWTEIAVTVLGAAIVGVVVIIGPPGRRWGLVTVSLLAALTALEGVSIVWSYLPDSSWLATGQAVSYLAAFAAAVCLARVAPERWPALLGGFAIAMTALCGWSLLVKVFPSTLAPGNFSGRLQAPFGYWNAIGLCAALGLPACLWVGARRDCDRSLAGLAAPALCLLLAVDVLSYSRSADAAGAVAIGIWMIFVPLRFRSMVMLAIGAAGTAVISWWMLDHGALHHNNVALAAQDHAGHTFGIVIGIVLIVVTAVGVWASRAMDRISISATMSRRIDLALVAALALGVVACIGAVATSSRGLTGEVSHVWNQLTATNAHVSASAANRVFQFGSSRPAYWHQAIQVGEHTLFKGVGLLGFGVARLRYTTDTNVVSEAHSYVFEIFADLGLLGVVLMFALLGSWLAAAARPLALRVRGSTLEFSRRAEREGMVALAAIVIAFGVQSTLDWTWFFSGVAVPVLLCAGWLAGRGPLVAPAAVPASERHRTGLLDRLAARPVAAGAVALLVVAVALVGWLQWRPLHATEQLTRSESASNTAQAFPLARSAISSDPLSVAPYPWLCSLDMDVHDASAARSELVKAKNLQPQNPVTWMDLGLFDFHHRRIAQALPEFQRALDLDKTMDTTRLTALPGLLQSRAILAGTQQAPPRVSFCLSPS